MNNLLLFLINSYVYNLSGCYLSMSVLHGDESFQSMTIERVDVDMAEVKYVYAEDKGSGSFRVGLREEHFRALTEMVDVIHNLPVFTETDSPLATYRMQAVKGDDTAWPVLQYSLIPYVPGNQHSLS